MLDLQRMLKQRLSCEKGQSLTEFALLMCFAVVIFLIVYNSGIRDTASNAYNMAGQTLSPSFSYIDAIAEYGTMSNAELQQVDNGTRLAIDQSTLTTLGGKFIGMSKSELSALLNNASNDSLTNKGCILFDYEIIKTGNNDGDVIIKLRENGQASASNLEALQWMKGNYDTKSSDYSRASQNMSTRLFFSDDTIDPNGPVNGQYNDKGSHSATIRATFHFDANNKVDKVNVYMTRSVNISGQWKRENCDGLTDISVSN